MSSSRGASKKPPGAPAREPRARPRKPRAAPSNPGRDSAPLTIKPGPPQGPKPQPALSSKPRPGGTRRLSDIPLDEDEILVDAFEATLDGVGIRITAVLERTCVYVDPDGNRRLASKKNVWVEANKLPIRRRGIG